MLMYKYNEKKLYIGDTYSGTGRPPWGRPPHPYACSPSSTGENAGADVHHLLGSAETCPRIDNEHGMWQMYCMGVMCCIM